MKKTFIALILGFIALPLLLVGCGDGAITTFSTDELVTPAANYEIDTWGANSEVYEVTSKVNPNYTCMMIMLDSGEAMGLDCFPTK